MEPQDVQAIMQDPVARELLESRNPARLAYVALDGTPRVVPVGLQWDGHALVIGTVPSSPKVDALRAHPAVAITVDTTPPTWPPKVLLVRGTSTVTHVEGARCHQLVGRVWTPVAARQQQERRCIDPEARHVLTEGRRSGCGAPGVWQSSA